jgi:2-polyprenyl-3-methyl-5-hydroxy-6-metoxy-1,4-benzoquinol methylase
MPENLSKNKKSITFYNENVSSYCARTLEINMETHYKKFLKHLPDGATILDAGSGSGRDTKKFIEYGYRVISIDASKEMVMKSSEYTQQQTLQISFEDLNFDNEFHGIWCSGSLVHTPSSDLLEILRKFKKALKYEGVWFLSFKSGDFEGVIDNRYFTHMTKAKISSYFTQLGGFEILEIYETPSEEKNRDVLWLQCLAKLTDYTAQNTPKDNILK